MSAYLTTVKPIEELHREVAIDVLMAIALQPKCTSIFLPWRIILDLDLVLRQCRAVRVGLLGARAVRHRCRELLTPFASH